jgi:hypothetical protein
MKKTTWIARGVRQGQRNGENGLGHEKQKIFNPSAKDD